MTHAHKRTQFGLQSKNNNKTLGKQNGFLSQK